jgi:quinol monooxygenase YgiN
VTNKIRKVVEISINEGQLKKFKNAAGHFIERVKSSEPDTLIYDWYFNVGESKCYIIEEYKDSEALLTHLANIRNLYKSLFEVSEITRIEIFGDPSTEVRQAHMAGTEFLRHWSGV